MSDIRIISATVHHESNEVEIIVEVDGHDLYHENSRLFTMYVDADEVIKKGQEWEKYCQYQ